MKFLLIPLFLIGVVNAQNKYDNAVIIHNVTFDSAVNKLIEMGYKLRVVDKNLKTCITESSVSNLSIYVNVYKDSNLVITSKFIEYYLGSGTSGSVRVMYFKHGVQHDRWEEMMKYAGQFSNIKYGRVK